LLHQFVHETLRPHGDIVGRKEPSLCDRLVLKELSYCTLNALTGHAGSTGTAEEGVFRGARIVPVEVRWGEVLKDMDLDESFHQAFSSLGWLSDSKDWVVFR